jgi:hypothetical protein
MNVEIDRMQVGLIIKSVGFTKKRLQEFIRAAQNIGKTPEELSAELTDIRELERIEKVLEMTIFMEGTKHEKANMPKL